MYVVFGYGFGFVVVSCDFTFLVGYLLYYVVVGLGAVWGFRVCCWALLCLCCLRFVGFGLLLFNLVLRYLV